MRSFATFIPALACLVLFSAGAAAQTTSFTYQGRITDSSIPPTGTYPMVFKLFAVPNGGTEIASSTFPNVPVASGVFTVTLDFGNNFDGGGDRYLEITVGGVVLTPRQRITSAPYAIRSSKAAAADTATNAANAANANTLDGLDSKEFAAAIHTHDVSQVMNAASTGANLFSGTQTVQTAGAAGKGVIVRGAASQSGNLQEWQNNAGDVLASIDPTGNVTLTGTLTLPVTTRVFSIAGPAFHSNDPTDSYFPSTVSVQGTVPGQTVGFHAPVHLPHGATVTQVDALVFDNDSSLNIRVRVHRLFQSGFQVTNLPIADIVSGGTAPGIHTLSDTTIVDAIIDNDTNSYFAEATWIVPTIPSNIRFYSVKITYTVTTPLP